MEFFLSIRQVALRSGLSVREVRRKIEEAGIEVQDGHIHLEDADKIIREALKEEYENLNCRDDWNCPKCDYVALRLQEIIERHGQYHAFSKYIKPLLLDLIKELQGEK